MSWLVGIGTYHYKLYKCLFSICHRICPVEAGNVRVCDDFVNMWLKNQSKIMEQKKDSNNPLTSAALHYLL
jgi:hypothetical protein